MPIRASELQLGDILISVTGSISVSHCGLVAGNITTGTNVMNQVERPGLVCHATSGGILSQPAGTWIARGESQVFRMTHLPAGAGKLIGDAAQKLAARCQYGKTRAIIRSWMGTSDYGPSAKGRLYTYMARLGFSGNEKFIASVYCSEFVVLSYQIAAKGDEASPIFINLDGKHTLPKDLRNWLLQRTKIGGKWLLMGNLTS